MPTIKIDKSKTLGLSKDGRKTGTEKGGMPKTLAK